ncbi:hypothetical protein [Methanolobus psychrotolerans]|uniref:hypothetical protein n=1 Tax=Methanolobus psychrotolerans TaxID=1874706 RepID=UPI00101AE613|nr:hypothetical protein [Methanolobus psychrotolerans]
MLLLLASIHFVNEAYEQETARENARIANETKQQMEYIKNLQAESERIFTQDQDVQNLLDENTNFRVYEIIHNDSLIEYIYITGFHLQKFKYAREPRMVNGTVYKFYINLNNKNVINQNDETFVSFNQSSHVLILKNDFHKEKDGITFDSSMITFVWPGVHHYDRLVYDYKIVGHQNIDTSSSSTKRPAMEYQLQIKKMDDTDSIYLPLDTTGDNVRILSGNNSLSAKYWKDERKREVNTLTMSLPGKVSYPIDWYYRWNVGSGTNQTIVFDIDMTVDGWINNAEPKELCGWRFIIETPPNTNDMSEEEMMELGVWPTNGFGNFYPLSTTIVKKGEWLENA